MLWAFHALASHQDVQDRLRNEINAAGDGKGSELKYSDIYKLELLDHFVKEVLRCYPPCKCLPH